MSGDNRIAMYTGPRGIMSKEVGSFLLGRDVPLATLTAKDIHNGGLAGFPAVVFPGGWGPVMSAKARKNVKDFVADGGGYIGICASITFTQKLKLLDFRTVEARGIGGYYIRVLRRHPVTKGYRLAGTVKPPKPQGLDLVRISRVNGAYILPGEGARMLASYDNEKTLGAIVAGKYGRGNVVLFSPHPELSVEPPPAWEAQRWQDPGNLLINAIDFVAGGKR